MTTELYLVHLLISIPVLVVGGCAMVCNLLAYLASQVQTKLDEQGYLQRHRGWRLTCILLGASMLYVTCAIGAGVLILQGQSAVNLSVIGLTGIFPLVYGLLRGKIESFKKTSKGNPT